MKKLERISLQSKSVLEGKNVIYQGKTSFIQGLSGNQIQFAHPSGQETPVLKLFESKVSRSAKRDKDFFLEKIDEYLNKLYYYLVDANYESPKIVNGYRQKLSGELYLRMDEEN